MTNATDSKPHRGRISDWVRFPTKRKNTGLGYFITGRFLDHPSFAGNEGFTSYVVHHDKKTGEIETRDGRYTLINEIKP